jgi:hypothetical protein
LKMSKWGTGRNGPLFARARTAIFRIPPAEASFARRGFRVADVQARERLEQIGAAFLSGYHAALEEDDINTLGHRLHCIESELAGFAFEGAAMALTLLDGLMPWRLNSPEARLATFLRGPGAAHIYMMHVGVGWALARLPWPARWPPRWLDLLLRWLAVDGYGFHQGYFDWQHTIKAQARPAQLSGYACRAFDQGLGRSLWFVEGADVAHIAQTIATFPLVRQADLWSGVGLACAYAGGVDKRQIIRLRIAAGPYRACLAQGAAFAAKARQRAGILAGHTALACEILCTLSAEAAANLTDDALADLPSDGVIPAYEVWRQRIQTCLTST